MKKTFLTRLLTVILSAALLFEFVVFGSGRPNSVAVDASPKTIEMKYRFDTFPEAVDEKENTDVLSRIDTDEDDLSIIKYYIGRDECKMIAFPYNVKYVDVNGITKDKSNKLVSTGEGYVNPDNDISSFFPSSAYNGVTVTGLGHTFTLLPVSDYLSETEVICDGETVKYTGVFGEGTELVYRATFTGNKSDIVLTSPSDVREFKFSFESETLEVGLSEAGYSVFDGETVICDFGALAITDSAGHSTYGVMGYDGGIITVSIPAEFAEDPSIVYPVTVDPQIIFRTDSQYGSVNIITSQLMSTRTATGGDVLNDVALMLGHLTQTKYNTVAVQFPHLKNLLTGLDGTVSSVKFRIYRTVQYTGTVATTIVANPITTGWNTGYYNDTAYSNLFYANTTAYQATSSLPANASASGSNLFDISAIADKWKQGNYTSGTKVNGICLKLLATTDTIGFHGANTATSSKMPQLIINYTMPATASGIIENGIYIFSPFTSDTTVSQYHMAKTSDSTTALKAGSVFEQNYPLSSGKISYIHDTAQLFQITAAANGIGYAIKCLGNGKFLTYSSSSLSYSTSEDTSLMYTTNWYITKVGSRYMLSTYWNSYIECTSPSTLNSNVKTRIVTETVAPYWDLTMYMLGVEHRGQPSWTTCGPTSVWMVLNYFGVNLAGVGMRNPDNINHGTNEYIYYASILGGYNEYIQEVGQACSGYYAGYGCEQVCAAINHYYPGHYTNWASPSIPSTYSYSDMRNIVEYNIQENYPIVAMISVSDCSSLPFTNNVPEHFVVVCGLYTDVSGTERVVLADSYPTSDPTFIDYFPNHYRNPAYAYVDMPLSDLWGITLYRSFICNYYSIP